MQRTMDMCVLVGLLFMGMFHVSHAQQTTRIAGADYLADAPTIIAQTKGFFKAQGLDAQVSFNSTGKESLARLRAGEVDFALTTLTPLVIDRLADPDPGEPDDPVILSSIAHSTNLMQIVSRQHYDIDRPEALEGLRVAIAGGTNSEYVWWLLTRFHQIDPANVTVLNQSGEEMVEGLLSGLIDLAVLWQPLVVVLENRIASNNQEPLHYFDENKLYAGKWVLVTSRRVADERADLCRQVLRSYRNAIEFMEREPIAAFELLERRAGVQSKSLERHWEALDYDMNLDWSLIGSLQRQFIWAQTKGYEPKAGTLQVLDMIASDPLRVEWPRAVGIPSRPSEAYAP